MLDFCIYLLYRAGSFLIGLLPLPFVFALGELSGVGRLAGPSEISAPRIPQFARLLSETRRARARCVAWCGNISGDSEPICFAVSNSVACRWKKSCARIDVENVDEVHRLLKNKTPIVFLLSHLGNWELLAQLFPHYFDYVRASTVYQKLGNRYIDAACSSQRAPAPASNFSIAAKDFTSHRIAPRRRRYRDSRRPTRRRPRSVDAILRPARFDFAAPGVAGQTHRRRADRRSYLHRQAGALADGFHPALRLAGDSVESLTAKANEMIERADSARAGRLVLGSQSMENAEAEFSPHAI